MIIGMYMNHTTLAVVAIVAVAALLITATSLGATQAFAHKHGKYSKTSQRSNAAIEQQNDQSAVCSQPATVNIVPISCNEIGLNANVAPATSANVITH
jgi:hypothetical protein